MPRAMSEPAAAVAIAWDSAQVTAAPRQRWVAPVLGLLQVAAFLPYLLAGLVVPEGQLLVVRAVWVVFAVVAVLVYRRNRLLSLVVPVATFLTAIALIAAGGALFGWSG